MRLYADYHTHTRHSHGTGTVLDNVRMARRRGLSEVAIADHGPASLFGVGVKSLETFAEIRRDVEQANTLVPEVETLLGVEANIVGADGELDIPEEMQRLFDLVLAGLHILVRPRSWWIAGQIAAANATARFSDRARRAALVRNTDLLVAAVYENEINIITHPGYRLPIDTAELARACAARRTALEINASHAHTTLRYIELAAAAGAKFAIGSDAHESARVGDLARGLQLAQAAGLLPEQVLNAVTTCRGNLD